MHRALESLGGGILGLVVGFFLCSPLIAHVFGPTTVTWDATACPAGLYTITSTATSPDGSRTFTATTQQIELPRSSVVQNFGEIPVGQYQVTAVARDASGRTFESSRQTVTGEGLPPTLPTPPVPEPPIVTAQRRNRGRQGPVTPPVPASHRPPAKASTTSAIAGTVRLLTIDRLMADAGVQALLTVFPQWKSVALVDSDADGAMDTVRVEWLTGEVVYFVVNQ